jgi:hypothetical protein
MKIMKKIILAVLLFVPMALSAQQRYIAHNGHVSFFSHAPIEDIEANNDVVSSIISNGDIAFEAPIKSFVFKKELMQEHFNENYLESDKYPNATFKGTIVDYSKIDLKKNGSYPVEVDGSLTMHGVTNKVKAKGTFTVKDNTIRAQSTFPITLKDYNISIPTLIVEKLAEVVKVTVDINYQPYTK